MSTDKIDPKNPTEVLPKDAKTELTEVELAKVSGGVTFTYGKLQVSYQAQAPNGDVKSA